MHALSSRLDWRSCLVVLSINLLASIHFSSPAGYTFSGLLYGSSLLYYDLGGLDALRGFGVG